MLPQYSKQYRPDDLEFEGDGSAQPFLSSSHKGATEPESEPPGYTPAPPTLLEERGTVEYRYSPVYPRKGDSRSAVGFLGGSLRETIQIVQRGFPDLAEIEPSRIRFENKDGAVILDEVWNHFTKDSPKRLEIVVEDGPGEREQRDRRENIVMYSIIGSIALVIFAIFILIFTHRR